MADYIYVDNSNVFIESKRVSAVAKGIAMNVYDAMNNGILDYDYKMSFGRLHECVAEQDRSKMLGRFFLDHGRHPMIRSGPTLSEPDSSLFLKIETSETRKRRSIRELCLRW